jgi:hypothetical protein
LRCCPSLSKLWSADDSGVPGARVAGGMNGLALQAR